MNDQDRTSLDPRIADWLEGDPNEAPDQALQIVLAAFPSVRQRHAFRVPRRFSDMNTTVKLALGAAAVIAVVLGGAFILGPPTSPGVGDPGPTPSARPTPSAAPSPTPLDPTTWTPYTSPRYGYQAAYPSDWSYGASSAFWTVPEPEGDLVPMIDYVYGGYRGTDATWAATSMKVPEGMTSQEWIDLYRSGQIDPAIPIECFPPPEEWGPVTVDGRPGSLKEGCGILEAILFVDGRVYVFGGWVSATTTPGVPDDFREAYEVWLTTITLDPASALEPPPASPSPSPS